MKTITLTQHVADQVAALEAAGERRRNVLRPLMLALLALVVAAVALLLVRGQPGTALLIGGGGGIALLVLGVIALAGPSEPEVSIKRAGAAGETVLPRLLHPLPDSYTLLNGVPVPRARADIDHLLIGPTGVWAIEVKHHVGNVQCVGDAWGYTRLGQGGVPIEGHIGNPSQQAQRAANALEQHLRARSMSAAVQPMVVFTHPLVELHVEQATLPVLYAADLLPFVQQQPQRLAPAVVQQIVSSVVGS